MTIANAIHDTRMDQMQENRMTKALHGAARIRRSIHVLARATRHKEKAMRELAALERRKIRLSQIVQGKCVYHEMVATRKDAARNKKAMNKAFVEWKKASGKIVEDDTWVSVADHEFDKKLADNSCSLM